jgi:DNA mismatch endonuclease (patch repair protein)
MSRIHSSNTQPEIVFGKSLYKHGIHFRKQIRIIGKPDFGIKKYKIAVFIDGDFWHGHVWVLKGYKSINTELRKYSKFWRDKIRRNIRRDLFVTYELERLGWKVFRFWASDIKKDCDKYARKVLLYMRRKGYITNSI